MPHMKRSLLIASALIVAGTAMGMTGLTQRQSVRDYSPLGDTIPWVRLQATDGRWQSLHDRLGGRPAIIYVYDPAECIGCSDLPMEFRVIKNEVPTIQPLLIGTGANVSTFAQPLRDLHLDGAALIDEHNVLLKALKVRAEPLALIVGANGRILFVDTRITSRSSRYPMGQKMGTYLWRAHPALRSGLDHALSGEQFD